MAVFRGIPICDFWGAYNKISALAKQRCFSPLFTELAKVVKTNSSAACKAFRKKLLRLLKDAIRLHERKDRLQKTDYDRLKVRLSDRLGQFLKVNYTFKDGKRLKRHKNELFTFLDYEGVSPTIITWSNSCKNQCLPERCLSKIDQNSGAKLKLS